MKIADFLNTLCRKGGFVSLLQTRTEISVDTKHQTLTGIAFPISQDAMDRLRELVEGAHSYVQLVRHCCWADYYRPQKKVMFSQVSVCPQSASWLLVHCLALSRRGRYASYWNAFLLHTVLASVQKQMTCRNVFLNKPINVF